MSHLDTANSFSHKNTTNLTRANITESKRVSHILHYQKFSLVLKETEFSLISKKALPTFLGFASTHSPQLGGKNYFTDLFSKNLLVRFLFLFLFTGSFIP